MNPIVRCVALGAVAGWALAPIPAAAQLTNWVTVVNNGDQVPPGPAVANFNSYNQPSVNAAGLVVFRARSAGPDPTSGIYQRDMSGANPIIRLTARGEVVPQPNNTFYNGVLASFEEFPSTPRIDAFTSLVATRGQSQPVWTYLLAGADTRVGTSGIYANPGGVLTTAASLLGAAVEADQFTLSFPQYSVPGAPAGTRFDQFPGSPAVSDGRYIAFKGNYTNPSDLLGKTGVYYRDMSFPGPGPAPTVLVANSFTRIPNQPAGGTTTFGSTAPPSAANGRVVFTGLDIEEAPTLGGIYRSYLSSVPIVQTLDVLVGIGTPVPFESEADAFNLLGEGLSLSTDGRYMSFWGAWGSETFQKTLVCPVDGNQDLIAFCNATYPNGYVVDIPVHQGIFVHDAETGRIWPAAKTGQDGVVDFLFWVFSGRPPGTTGGDEGAEPPRWRASGFSAVSRVAGQPLQVAYKAEKAGNSGIYLREGLGTYTPPVTVVETVNTLGTSIDPQAPADSRVISVGVERDGFRDGNLALTVSMLYVDPVDPEISLGWAGIYLNRVVGELVFADSFE